MAGGGIEFAQRLGGGQGRFRSLYFSFYIFINKLAAPLKYCSELYFFILRYSIACFDFKPVIFRYKTVNYMNFKTLKD